MPRGHTQPTNLQGAFIMVVNIATTRAINGDSTRGPTGASAPLDMSLAPPVAPRDDQIK